MTEQNNNATQKPLSRQESNTSDEPKKMYALGIGVLAATAGTLKLSDMPAVQLAVHLGMEVTVSILGLLASLYVILSKRGLPPGAKHWAYGTAGLIVGFWLKT
jgi:hypothetical protein